MVEDADIVILLSSLCRRDSHQPVQRLLAHCLVRAQRHQVIQRSDPSPQQLMEQSEEEGDRRGASVVGDDDQHALAVEIGPRQRFGHQTSDIAFIQKLIGISFTNEHSLRLSIYSFGRIL